MKILKQTKQNGFTLIETVIYIAIIGLVLVCFVSFVFSISSSRNKSYAQEEVNANLRAVLNTISQKIKFSSGVNFTSSTFGVNPGVLSLSMVSSSLNPTIINIETSSMRVRIFEGASQPQYLTGEKTRVTNLVFTNLTGDSSSENIGIDLTIIYATSTNDFMFSKSWQTAVSIRQ